MDRNDGESLVVSRHAAGQVYSARIYIWLQPAPPSRLVKALIQKISGGGGASTQHNIFKETPLVEKLMVHLNPYSPSLLTLILSFSFINYICMTFVLRHCTLSIP